MKRIIFTLALGLFWPTLALAKPLLIQWPLYVSTTTPAARLILYRGVGTSAPVPYTTITNLGISTYVDYGVKVNNKQYCYWLQAVTADDISSALTAPACATPLK